MGHVRACTDGITGHDIFNHIGMSSGGGIISLGIHEIMLHGVLVGQGFKATGEYDLCSRHGKFTVGIDGKRYVGCPAGEAVSFSGSICRSGDGFLKLILLHTGQCRSIAGNKAGVLILDLMLGTIVVQFQYQRIDGVNGALTGVFRLGNIEAEANDIRKRNCNCFRSHSTLQVLGLGVVLVVTTGQFLKIVLHGIRRVTGGSKGTTDHHIRVGHDHFSVFNGRIAGADGPAGEGVAGSRSIRSHNDFFFKIELLAFRQSRCTGNRSQIFIADGVLLSAVIQVQHRSAVGCNHSLRHRVAAVGDEGDTGRLAANRHGLGLIKFEADMLGNRCHDRITGPDIAIGMDMLRLGRILTIGIHHKMLDNILVGSGGKVTGNHHILGRHLKLTGRNGGIFGTPTGERVTGSRCVGGKGHIIAVLVLGSAGQSGSITGDGTQILIGNRMSGAAVIQFQHQCSLTVDGAGGRADRCLVAEAHKVRTGQRCCGGRAVGNAIERLGFGVIKVIVGLDGLVVAGFLLEIVLHGVDRADVSSKAAAKNHIAVGHDHFAVFNSSSTGANGPTGEGVAGSGGITLHFHFLTVVVFRGIGSQTDRGGICTTGDGADILVGNLMLISGIVEF